MTVLMQATCRITGSTSQTIAPLNGAEMKSRLDEVKKIVELGFRQKSKTMPYVELTLLVDLDTDEVIYRVDPRRN